ncbi:hypothetical protein ACFWAY_22335 [Rhodococcus sp. NPDC059968]|uniref:hypothetical protein n=1 Tax=Rhodococcus sp. NPDC059968 TaxID=3347017 RepID=UPI00366D7C94
MNVTVILSASALVFSAFSLFFTVRSANRREVEKTRREMLTDAVATLIEESTSRNQTIIDWHNYDGTDLSNSLINILLKHERGMAYQVMRIRIVGSGDLYECAHSLHSIHSDSTTKIVRWELGNLQTLEPRMSQEKLKSVTESLISTFRRETKLH